MSTVSYSRRQICQMGLAGLTSLSLLDLVACGGTSGTGTTTLQLFFWGPTSRNQLTRKAIQSFHSANPSINVQSSFTDWSTYWQKLDTQIAGGTVPDLIQMDLSYVAQFVKQNIIMDIAPYTSNKAIDLTNFDQTLVTNSQYNGKLYGAPLGGNYESMYYDTNLVQQAGMSAPPTLMTWAQFSDYTKELSAALKKQNIYGTTDTSGDYSNFEIWVRQRGKNLYTPDGKLGFEVTDLAEWFDYWKTMRTIGACVPAEVEASVAGSSGAATSLIIQRKVVFDNNHSNQFSSYQLLTQHKLALQMTPTGAQPGLYNKPAQLMSISTKSKHPDEAAKFINYLINTPKGIQTLGLDRGIPGNKDALNDLSATISASDKASLAYTQLIEQNKQARPLTILPPSGAGNFSTLLIKAAQAVSFNQVSASAGAQSFYTNMMKALS
jgi:multiple sugar transport system substrate-binding protein